MTLLYVIPKAWLATYFDLPHTKLRNLKAIRNCTQLDFLMVATRNGKFYIEVTNLEFSFSK